MQQRDASLKPQDFFSSAGQLPVPAALNAQGSTLLFCYYNRFCFCLQVFFSIALYMVFVCFIHTFLLDFVAVIRMVKMYLNLVWFSLFLHRKCSGNANLIDIPGLL